MRRRRLVDARGGWIGAQLAGVTETSRKRQEDVLTYVRARSKAHFRVLSIRSSCGLCQENDNLIVAALIEIT